MFRYANALLERFFGRQMPKLNVNMWVWVLPQVHSYIKTSTLNLWTEQHG